MNGELDSGLGALYKQYELFQQVDAEKQDFMTVGAANGATLCH
jgi:hypothetical protein